VKKRVIVIGGGTFSAIRNHLSLSAPAFGYTAKQMHKQLEGSELFLTKMANHKSKLISNLDVELFIDELLEDETVGTIILNAALCDYKAINIDGIECGWHAKRLETAKGDLTITLSPSEKIISKIRRKRPDIFLVGFKTTTDKSSDEQFLIALKMMKSSKCNLVLANDTVTRNNMIITPEETIYSETTDRKLVISELCKMIEMRNSLTYHRGIFKPNSLTTNVSFNSAPDNFKTVIKFLIENGGYLENNGNGFTPGHFCYRLDVNSDNKLVSFVSSQRKVNHNMVEYNGMTLVKIDDEGVFHYIGTKKPSVGARSQYLMLQSNPEMDFIVHTHNPLKVNSNLPIASQKPFQCGSDECGLNTLNNLASVDENIKAVFLDKHGINILFSKNADPNKVIEFIKENIELGIKIK